jgi:osmotically inducible protein OsmC
VTAPLAIVNDLEKQLTMERTAEATWRGGLKTGTGLLSTESEALNATSYAYNTRFEEQKGTNPEELIGAAHAGCFTMALAAALEKDGHTPEELHTTARVVLEKIDDLPTISTIHLDLKGRVPGIDLREFRRLAETTKENCIVSRLLNARIDLEVALELVAA